MTDNQESKELEREIFMSNGNYKMCKVINHSNGFYLCFHPDKGEFIAGHKLGTVGELDAIELHRKIKQLTTTQQSLKSEIDWHVEKLKQTQQALDSAVEALKTAKRLLKHHHEVAKADIETYIKLEDGTLVPLNAAEGYAESGFWEETEAALASISGKEAE